MPYKTPSTSTAATEPTTNNRSRFIRQTAIKGPGDIACHSALITAIAKTGLGSKCSAGNANARAAAITAKAAAPAQRLCAPAAALAEVAENPAPTGIPCSSDAAILQAPSTSSSLFAFSVSPCVSAWLRILPHDSANISTTRPNANCVALSHSFKGRLGS